MTSGSAGSALTPEPAARAPIVDLGRVPFGAVLDQMSALANAVQRTQDPGAILLVEHEPVFTAGRATRPHELVPGIVPIERGGRVTYHGPGQLVVYPIVRLPRHDVRAWLRALEAFGSAVCGAFGLHATPSPDGTGVFVGSRKVASIGVAIRRWVNLHGIAVNVDMDLEPFRRIRPCGLDPERMSDLTREAGRRITMDEARSAARKALPLLQVGGEAVA